MDVTIQKWIDGTAVEILGRPPRRPDPADAGFDLVFPIGPGDRTPWIRDIDAIFLNGVPRGLRPDARVYLMQAGTIFFSAPILDVIREADRLSWITGGDHGFGPSMLVDLSRGRNHRIDATRLPTPDGTSWHNRRGIKYVTPGCKAFARLGPKPPLGAMKSRSSAEVALERSLAKHLPVDRQARRLRIHDAAPRRDVEVDICIPDARLVVEYDGVWYHGGMGSTGGAAKARARDEAKTARLRQAGLRVIRVRDRLPALDARWDVVLTGSETPDEIARKIVAVCRARRVSLSAARMAG